MPNPGSLQDLLDRNGWYRCSDNKIHYCASGEKLICDKTTAEPKHKVGGPTAWSLTPPSRPWCSLCWRRAKGLVVPLAEPAESQRTGQGRIPDLPGQTTLFEVT